MVVMSKSLRICQWPSSMFFSYTGGSPVSKQDLALRFPAGGPPGAV